MPYGYNGTQIKTTQDEILQAVRDLLVEEFSELPGDGIYWSETAQPNTDLNLDLFIQVHPGGGQFDQGIEIGGGSCEEASMFGVTVWHRSELDQSGKAEQSLFATSGGLLGLKRRVLKALRGEHGKALYNEAGEMISVGTIKPIQALEPSPADASSDPPLDRVQLFFQVAFDWDLS